MRRIFITRRKLTGLFSYRAGGIRTHDLLNPIQAHYQAVLRPDSKEAKDAAPGWLFQAGKSARQPHDDDRPTPRERVVLP